MSLLYTQESVLSPEWLGSAPTLGPHTHVGLGDLSVYLHSLPSLTYSPCLGQKLGLINKHLLSTNRVLCSKYIPFPVGLESTIWLPAVNFLALILRRVSYLSNWKTFKYLWASKGDSPSSKMSFRGQNFQIFYSLVNPGELSVCRRQISPDKVKILTLIDNN